jgi:hypothetical protein
MKIPYKVIDGIVYVDARVEVTEHFLNNMPTFDTNGEGGYFIMDHVHPGRATRVFGDVALVFLEPEQKNAPALEPIVYNAPDLGTSVDVRYAGGFTTENFMTRNDQNNQQGLAIQKPIDNQDYLKAIAEQYKKEIPTQQEPTEKDWEEVVRKFRKTHSVLIHGSVTILTKLGFQKRNECSWHHPLFGEDREDNWMHFDPETDDIQHVILKIYNYGWNKGRQNLRFEIKKALDIPLR